MRAKDKKDAKLHLAANSFDVVVIVAVVVVVL
jgi:hypothetical protein